MGRNESVDFFLRHLQEKHGEFRKRLEALLKALSNHQPERKLDACRQAAEALSDLKRSMSSKDHPPWIAPLNERLSWYLTQHKGEDAGLALLKTILSSYPQIESQKWDFADEDDTEPVDFDLVYQRHYNESRIPELFETLLENLQKVIDSGQVDSMKAILALETLIATIRKNTVGSYFATKGTVVFAKALFKNWLQAVLGDLPVIGHIVEAINKTMSDLEPEMARVHDAVMKDLNAQANEASFRPMVKGPIQSCLPESTTESRTEPAC